jgi:hypothetical protein
MLFGLDHKNLFLFGLIDPLILQTILTVQMKTHDQDSTFYDLIAANTKQILFGHNFVKDLLLVGLSLNLVLRQENSFHNLLHLGSFGRVVLLKSVKIIPIFTEMLEVFWKFLVLDKCRLRVKQLRVATELSELHNLPKNMFNVIEL